MSERCRALEGLNALSLRWHHVSTHEHFCQDCVDHYSRGEARKAWQAEQARGKCSFKEVVVRLHLPCWTRCTKPGCGKWRALPALTERADGFDAATWHCGLAEVVRGGDGGGSGGMANRGRRKVAISCDAPQDPAAALPEPPEEPGLAVPFIVRGASEDEVKDAVAESRLPWWDLSRFESAALRHSATSLSHPTRFVALRNLILFRWRERRATGWVSRTECLDGLSGPGLVRPWYAAALPDVYWWLERLGLINFGASSRLVLRIPKPPSASSGASATRSSRHGGGGHGAGVTADGGQGDGAAAAASGERKTIVVVGAGISGLCAAQQLRRFGHRVVVLEAQSRVGGRVLTEEVSGVPIDLGAMLLVGTVGNPLVTLCEQTGCSTHALERGECPLYDGSETLVPELDAKAEGKFNHLMSVASEQRAVRKGKRAMVGTSNGGRWERELLHDHDGGGAASWIGTGAAGGSGDGGGGEHTGGAANGGQGGGKKRKKGKEGSEAMAKEAAKEEEPSAEVKEEAVNEEKAAAAVQQSRINSGDGSGVAASAAEDPAIDYEAVYGVSGRPRNTWLACDLCGQWRRLGKMKDKDLPETWTCDQNPDEAYARCEVPQELPDDDIDRLLGLLPPKPKVPREKAAPPAPSPKALAKKAAAACAPMPGEAPPVCGKSLGEVLDKLVEKAKLPAEEARVIHWHLANLEYGCATALDNVSLSWWDQDDGNDFNGDHVVVTNGFDRMVQGLAAYLEVLVEREVAQIEYHKDGVRVHTRGGGEGIEADAVLITVPLGVLKAKTISFDPPLPPWKRQAIERLGFGPIEKIVLLFDKRFWDESTDFFGCLPPADLSHDELSARRGEFFMFWNLDRSHGVPALLCVSSGAFAVSAWRSHSYKGVVNKALAVLRRTFGSVATSSYKRSVVSDWGRNPYARGSYSYVAVGGSGRDYDELAWPVGVDSQRVFFGGEHTNGQHPATATGAFITGLREAQRIDECARAGFPPASAQL